MYAIHMTSGGILYTPSLIKTLVGIDAILKFCFRKLRGSSVDVLMGGIYELRL
jgi:hypothetical protein